MRIFYGDLLISVFLLLLGLIWIYGTWKKWKFFVNPSEDFWWMWFWHLIHKYFGEDGVRIFNYFIGLLILIGAVRFTFNYFIPRAKFFLS